MAWLTQSSASSSRAPWLAIHSREDELVDEKQSLLWMEYLHKNGITAELKTGMWGLHWDGTCRIGTPQDSISPLVLAFIKRVLSPS